MKRLKVIIAGTANPHIPAYLHGRNRNVSDIDIIAVSEPDPQRRSMIQGLPVYADYRELFQRHPEADCVMIGCDNVNHLELFQHAMEHKLHIYMMKVISMDEQECLTMLELEKHYDRIIACELELRFNAQFRYARKIMEEGRLGTLQSIYLTNISQSPCNYFPNWGTPELSYGKRIPIHPGDNSVFRGGAITDHPHPFDVIRWLTGEEFATVNAVSARNQRSHLQVEDHAAITGELTNGVPYFINPSYSNLEEKTNCRRLLWPKSLECNLKITGDKGYFACDYFDRHIYILGNRFPSPDRCIVDFAHRLPMQDDKTLLGSFVATIRGQHPKVETGLNESYQAVRVMNAAYESIYHNQEIQLSH